MGSWPRLLRKVTYRAFAQCARMPLQLDELDGIICLAAGSDGMCAVMAGFTIDPAVPFRKAVQGLVLVELLGIGRGMAVITAWFVQPRIRVLCHLQHPAMAVYAVHFSIRVKR